MQHAEEIDPTRQLADVRGRDRLHSSFYLETGDIHQHPAGDIEQVHRHRCFCGEGGADEEHVAGGVRVGDDLLTNWCLEQRPGRTSAGQGAAVAA